MNQNARWNIEIIWIFKIKLSFILCNLIDRGTGKNDSFRWLFHEEMWSRIGTVPLIPNRGA